MIGCSMSNRSVRRVRRRMGVSKTSPLALRAPEGRSSVLREPPHHAAAAGGDAGLAFAAVDLERVLEIAEFAGGLAVVAERRAAGGNGLVQHRMDRLDQADRVVGRRALFGR